MDIVLIDKVEHVSLNALEHEPRAVQGSRTGLLSTLVLTPNSSFCRTQHCCQDFCFLYHDREMSLLLEAVSCPVRWPPLVSADDSTPLGTLEVSLYNETVVWMSDLHGRYPLLSQGLLTCSCWPDLTTRETALLHPAVNDRVTGICGNERDVHFLMKRWRAVTDTWLLARLESLGSERLPFLHSVNWMLWHAVVQALLN